ncbi:MAG TPA: hypothetical protein VGF18_06045 [Candidatus Tumulicola sp.]|jgi:hypothetical protein
MKYILPALSLALLIVPATASAQNAPPQPAGASSHGWPDRKNMLPMMQKAEQLRRQFRSQALSALSSQHRDAVGNIIGAMAVSASPDPRAAAQRIDGVLNDSERQAILSAKNSYETQSRALREQMRAQMAQQMGTAAPSPRPMRSPRPGSNDAGNVLMMALMPFGPGFGGMPGHGMHGGMPPNGMPPPGGPPPDPGANGGPPPQP